MAADSSAAQPEPTPLVLDLTNRDQEPIHIPGAVQAHGILFALSGADLHITAVTAMPAVSDSPLAVARLLLIDDDPDTQAAVAAYAGEAGHGLIVAGNAREALSLLDAGRAVDIMIVDSTLPGMPCTELVAQASQRQPGLAFLFIDGQTKAPAIDGIPVLAKPFRQDAFNRAIGRLIGAQNSSANVIRMRRGFYGQSPQ